MEIFNDANSNIPNLYTCVRDHSKELIDELTYVLNCREDFDKMKHIVHEKASSGDVKRAAQFYQLIRYSYSGSCDSFGGRPHSIWSDFPIITRAAERLQKVVIENRDFEKIISQHDSKTTFFYLDPPYYFSEAYYNNVKFTANDHNRLALALKNIEGFFLLSYNDCIEIRTLYKDYYIFSYERLSNMSQRYDGGSTFRELLISNYDMEKRISSNKQITLFNDLEELKNGVFIYR